MTFEAMNGNDDYVQRAARRAAADPAVQMQAEVFAAMVAEHTADLREQLTATSTAYAALIASLTDLAGDTDETPYLRERAQRVLDDHFKEHSPS